MTALRTLPEALADAARTDESYLFVADGIETRRSFADLRLASLGVARALREGGVAARRSCNAGHRRRRTVLDDAVRRIPGGNHSCIAVPARGGRQPVGVSRGHRANHPSGGRARRHHDQRLASAVRRHARELPQHRRRAVARHAGRAADRAGSHGITRRHRARAVHLGVDGSPEGVVLTHRSLSANIDAINGPAGLGSRPPNRP